MEPGEEQFVAECENDRAYEQADDPGREKSTYAASINLTRIEPK
jgi:hypothetical protein